LAGMPEETLERAREILFQLECRRATPEEAAEEDGQEQREGEEEEEKKCGRDARAPGNGEEKGEINVTRPSRSGKEGEGEPGRPADETVTLPLRRLAEARP